MGKEVGRNNYLHERCQIFLVTFKSNNFGEIKNLYVGNTLSFPSRIQHLKHSPSGVLQRGGRSPFGVLINCGLVCVHLVGGFNPSEKYEFVSWYILNIWKVTKFMFETTSQSYIIFISLYKASSLHHTIDQWMVLHNGAGPPPRLPTCQGAVLMATVLQERTSMALSSCPSGLDRPVR